jgi:hypothetical protein
MIAPAQAAAPALPAVLTDQFIASYGKSGGLGCFTARTDAAYQRGDRVLLQTPRGLEAGVVLGGATLRQARLLGSQSSGAIVRPLDGDDEAELRQLRQRSDDVFALGRQIAAERRLAVEILDAELLADGKQAILHIAARAEDALGDFAADLARRVGVNVVFENLSASVAADEEPTAAAANRTAAKPRAAAAPPAAPAVVRPAAKTPSICVPISSTSAPRWKNTIARRCCEPTNQLRETASMSCPFPGMDPYLEQPAFWADFHSRFMNGWCEDIDDACPMATIATWSRAPASVPNARSTPGGCGTICRRCRSRYGPRPLMSSSILARCSPRPTIAASTVASWITVPTRRDSSDRKTALGPGSGLRRSHRCCFVAA